MKIFLSLFRLARVAVAGLALVPAAQAQPSPPPLRPGIACIEQLCLGDDLERLRGLAWEPLGELAAVAMPAGAAPAPWGALQSLYRADEAVWPLVAPYLLAERFDGNTLAVLDQVRFACGKHELRGNFIAWGGEPTRVGIALRPAPQGEQRWQVVSITQAVPAAASEAQRAEITARLHERYRGFDVTKLHNPQPGANTFFITATPEHFTYNLFLYRGLKEEAQLKRNTACGGSGAAEAPEAPMIAAPQAATRGAAAKPAAKPSARSTAKSTRQDLRQQAAAATRKGGRGGGKSGASRAAAPRGAVVKTGTPKAGTRAAPAKAVKTH